MLRPQSAVEHLALWVWTGLEDSEAASDKNRRRLLITPYGSQPLSSVQEPEAFGRRQ